MAKSGRQLACSIGSLESLLPRIEVRGHGRSQMAAGREAQDADALRIEVPLLGLGTHGANRPLRIAQRRGMPIARARVGT